MVQRYFQFLGLEQTKQLLIANEKPLKPYIRVNTLKIEPNILKSRLENKGFKLKANKWLSYAFEILKSPYSLGATHEFLLGYYYVQNLASMLPVSILNPQKGDLVIDMCAAPGSKATQLAQIMEDQGNLILIEKNPKRIPALIMNIRRLGITNSIVLNFDAIKLNQYNIKADKILLDAPCTGEGLIREDPTRRKSRSINDLKKLSIIQKQLLKSGLLSLKPSGQLLYSTCSIAPEENELVVNEVLNELKDFSIAKISKGYGANGLNKVFGLKLRDDLRFSQRFYPHLQDTIGFYLCVIQKLD
ncbi:MAG: RsmB/NOP family class I SAM-dependent RNA methyltransferase [Promethearchaeota archaeon]|nr:MAG: RsmB/NOP family class I SAM-dependent RNA methyltransferase [Candidatus Lokiarchaeota archaeon]